MKAIFRRTQNHCVRIKPSQNQRAYWAAIWLASLACGGTAVAQTNNPTATSDSGASTNATKLTDVDVVSRLDAARTAILPNLGATATSFSADQIQSISQGGNAPFNEVILRAPGVAQDSAANGDLHVRGEHANLQYRINDVLLPEGITGFGLELDPRFVKSMQLITGSLPAQYGFRTAGVVDIQTKSGAFENGGDGGNIMAAAMTPSGRVSKWAAHRGISTTSWMAATDTIPSASRIPRPPTTPSMT